MKQAVFVLASMGILGGLTACSSSGLDAGLHIPYHAPLFLNQTKQSDLNKLNINGKTIELVPSSHLNHRDFYITDDRAVGTFLKYARFGYVDNHLFTSGIKASDLPTFGTFVYTGRAIHQQNNKQTQEYARFNVDFGNKTITGGIGLRGEILPLQARLDQDSFSGTNNGVKMEGKLFGFGGLEMAGYYYNGNESISGAFGAAR